MLSLVVKNSQKYGLIFSQIALKGLGKPVYKWWIKAGKTCVQLATDLHKSCSLSVRLWVNAVSSTVLPTVKTTALSTALKPVLPLLNSSFTQFPQYLLILKRLKNL